MRNTILSVAGLMLSLALLTPVQAKVTPPDSVTGLSNTSFVALSIIASVPAQDSDGRINAGYGDLIIALYVHYDKDDSPMIQGYCINKRGRGLQRLIVNQSDIDKTLAIQPKGKHPMPRNRLVERAKGCKAAFYILTNGQYQINIGPDIEGKAWVIVFDTLEAKNISRTAYNIYDS